jgi:hypothetical protein
MEARCLSKHPYSLNEQQFCLSIALELYRLAMEVSTSQAFHMNSIRRKCLLSWQIPS